MHQLKFSYNSPLKIHIHTPFTPVLRWLLVIDRLSHSSLPLWVCRLYLGNPGSASDLDCLVIFCTFQSKEHCSLKKKDEIPSPSNQVIGCHTTNHCLLPSAGISPRQPWHTINSRNEKIFLLQIYVCVILWMVSMDKVKTWMGFPSQSSIFHFH